MSGAYKIIYHGSSLNLTLNHVTVNIRVEGAILVNSEEAILAHSKGATHRSRVRLQVEYKTENPPQLKF
jgi:hypothetical protein